MTGLKPPLAKALAPAKEPTEEDMREALREGRREMEAEQGCGSSVPGRFLTPAKGPSR